jgi:hypothetical protein
MTTPAARLARLKCNPFLDGPLPALTDEEKQAAEQLFGRDAPLEPGDEPRSWAFDLYSVLERRRLALEQIPGRSDVVRRLRAAVWRWLFGPEPASDEEYTASLASTVFWLVGDDDAADLLEQALRAFYIDPNQVSRIDAGLAPLTDERLFGRVKGGDSGKKPRQRGALDGVHAPLIVADVKRDAGVLRTVCSVVAQRRFVRSGATDTKDYFARVAIVTRERPSDISPNVVCVDLPPLADRPGDIDATLATYLRREGASVPEPSRREVRTRLLAERTDLRGAIARAWASLPSDSVAEAAAGPATPPDNLAAGAMTLDQARTWYAQHVRSLCRSDREAARRLGITRVTLAKLLKSPT